MILNPIMQNPSLCDPARGTAHHGKIHEILQSLKFGLIENNCTKLVLFGECYKTNMLLASSCTENIHVDMR